MWRYWATVALVFTVRLPNGTLVAVEAPVVTVPATLAPVVVALIVKFKDGVTVAETVTDSIVATLVWVVSITLEPLSCSSIWTVEVSAVPCAAVLVGLSNGLVFPMAIVMVELEAREPVKAMVNTKLLEGDEVVMVVAENPVKV